MTSPSLLGTGEVIVDVAASRVLPYSNEVFSGERRYLLDLPAVPGPARSAVHAVGPDTTQIKAGDWVYCDPPCCATSMPPITLQGLSARGGGMKLQVFSR
jgi:alcohol dehydrogenase